MRRKAKLLSAKNADGKDVLIVVFPDGGAYVVASEP